MNIQILSFNLKLDIRKKVEDFIFSESKLNNILFDNLINYNSNYLINLVFPEENNCLTKTYKLTV